MDSAGARPRVLLYTVTVALTRGMPADGIFFKRPGVAVMRWEPAMRAVCIEWQGWADPSEFVAALEAGLGALVELRGSRWLADCREMKPIQQSDQEWLAATWIPRVLAAGLRRMAMVIPKSGLARTNLEDIFRKVASPKLETAYFAAIPEAEKWLSAPSTTTAPALEAPRIS
jgi:hypothetical protein